MIRWSEAALVLLPFAVFVAWRLAGSGWRWARRLLWVAVASLALVAATGVWLGVTGGHRPGVPYLPARVVGGRIVGGG